MVDICVYVVFVKKKTAYEMRISDWSSDVCSSDLFLGQTVAALVTGNTVIAKPAPQTPRIAARAVDLAHQAGVPEDVLVLVPGGPEVGAAITADLRIQGVAFTGPTGTARRKIGRAHV